MFAADSCNIDTALVPPGNQKSNNRRPQSTAINRTDTVAVDRSGAKQSAGKQYGGCIFHQIGPHERNEEDQTAARLWSSAEKHRIGAKTATAHADRMRPSERTTKISIEATAIRTLAAIQYFASLLLCQVRKLQIFKWRNSSTAFLAADKEEEYEEADVSDEEESAGTSKKTRKIERRTEAQKAAMQPTYNEAPQ